jgi:hypothetical protein
MAIRKQPAPSRVTQATTVRFEATLGPTPHRKAVLAAAELELDRLPDADGKVKLLLTADDARRLLEHGYEVHLTAAIPVAPLDQKRIMTDEQAKRWLEQQVKGMPKKGGR